MNNKFSLSIDKIDLAALLCSLGFEMNNFEVISHVDMNRNNRRTKSANFEFGNRSIDGRDLETVIKQYHIPAKGEKCLNVYQRARVAAHNYQCLKSVLLEGSKLQQIKCDGYTLLKNANGDDIEKTSHIPAVEHLYSNNLAVIAISTALGCGIGSYYLINNTLKCLITPSEDGITGEQIEQLFNSPSIGDPTNFNVIPVLIATFINREQLLKETYAKQTLHITNGYKQVLVSKDMSDEMKNKVLEFIN